MKDHEATTAVPTVYLFDVDGTLITTGGVGRLALQRAFGALYGRTDTCDHFQFGGMTDRGIFRQGLEALGLDATEEAIDQLLAAYLPILREEVAGASRYRAHDGVAAALEALEPLDGVALGLGTGNVEAGARIKIERVNLNGWFAFGGFGCDAEERAALIAAGARRGAQALGRGLGQCQVVIVGDTPKDVAAAHANGFLAFIVRTGSASEAELTAAEPDWLFDDLAAPGALESLVGARALVPRHSHGANGAPRSTGDLAT